MNHDAPSTVPARWSRRFVWVLTGVVFAGMVGTASFTILWRQYHWLTLAGPNTVGEAGKVYFAHQFATGESIFASAAEPPYYGSQHGALLHASVGLIARVLDLSVTQMYYAGRAISLIATLIALWLSGSILKRLGVSRWWLAAVVMSFFSSEVMTQHATSYRPDHWNLCLSVLCCWLLVSQAGGRWRVPLLAIIPAMAFFIKVPGLGLVMAIALGLLAERKGKAAAVCVIVPLLVVGAAVGAINWLSAGHLTAGLRWGMQMPVSVTTFFELIMEPRYWLVWLVPLVLVGRALPVRDEASRRWCVVWMFLWVEFIVGAVASMRAGSSTYYFVGSWLYGITLGVAWIAQTLREDEPASHPPAAAIVLMFSLLCMPVLTRFTPQSFPINSTTTPMNVAQLQTWAFGDERQEVAERINRLKLVCYSDDPGLNVLLDKPQIIEPLVRALLVENGAVTMDQLIAPVRQQQYDVMIMTGRGWEYFGVKNLPEPFLEAIEQYYQPVRNAGVRYQVFVPRKAED